MKILLNGEKSEWPEGLTLADLVARQAPSDRRVAVLHNGQVVSADRRGSVRLAPDDRVELVTLAPGG
jgi:sulfur carrier protein